MNIICTKCGSDRVSVKMPDYGDHATRTMDEVSMVTAMPAIYKMTTLVCEYCGYSVSS